MGSPFDVINIRFGCNVAISDWSDLCMVFSHKCFLTVYFYCMSNCHLISNVVIGQTSNYSLQNIYCCWSDFLRPRVRVL